MADEEKQEDDGLFDAVEEATEDQVAAEIWTRHFASTDTRRVLRFCQEQPPIRATSALVTKLNAIRPCQTLSSLFTYSPIHLHTKP